MPTLIPKRGGTHPIYGVFLEGGSVGAGWTMDDDHYHSSSQRRDEKSVRKVERGLTDARDKTTTLKFNGTLDLYGTEGSERELDKDQFVRTIEQLTREHGQQVFYAIEKYGTIHNLLRSPHLFTVEEASASHMMRLDTNSTDASKYDSFKNVKLLPLPQPPLRACTDARTNPSAQRATQLMSVLARV
jgi:hypothetical protein